MTRAAIYTRISSDRTGAGLGVERQEADARALADRLGYTVVAVHSDNDIGAYQRGKPRPGYGALLRDVDAGRCDAVVVWHLDRLLRRMADLEELIDLLEDSEVTVRTVTAGDLELSTASGRRNARILAAVASGETEQQRERIRAAKTQAAAAGRWLGGPRPFGYEDDGVTIREAEAAILRELTEAIIDGRSVHALSRELNERGVLTSRGKPWRPAALRPLLLRPRNAGLAGEDLVEAKWPAIVPRETWEACRAILLDESRRTNPGGGQAPKHLLSGGLARCGVCGGKMHVIGRDGRPVYRCSAAPGRCTSRPQKATDDLVLRTVAEKLAEPGARDLLAGEDDRAEALAQARRRATELRTRRDELAGLAAEGAMTPGQFKIANERLLPQITEAEEAVQHLAAQTRTGWLAAAPDPAEAFLAADVDRQRGVIADLLDVRIMRTGRGRRPVGAPEIDPESVVRTWKR